MVASFRFLFLLAVLLPLPAGAGDGFAVRLLVSDDNSYAQRAGVRLEALLRQAEPAITLEPWTPGASGRRLTVTVGAKAWRSYGAEAEMEGPVLAVAPTRPAFEEYHRTGGQVAAIHLEMPPGRIFNLIQAAMPQRTAVGMLASVSTLVGPQSRGQLGRFEASAAERGLRLVSEMVEAENEVGPAVERLVRQSAVFLAMPDPVVHTANTVQPLLLLTYRASVPVIGYSESYLKAGAILAIYATPEQIAQQAFETILAYRQGKALPATQVPRYYTVRINDTVARSLGLTLPLAVDLEGRLRQMRE